MQFVDLILSARWVLPILPRNQVLENYSVIVNRGTIVALLPTALVSFQYQSKNHQEFSQHILMPGLVNAHTHVPMNLFRGLAEDLDLMDWLCHHIWPAEKAVINADTVALGSELAIAEMLRGGVTCFNDHYFFAEIIAKTAIKQGIRAVVGNPIMNVPTQWAADEEEYLAKAYQTMNSQFNHDLIRFSVAVHAPYTNSDYSLFQSHQMAKKYAQVVHIHLNETPAEIKMSVQNYQKRPLQRLKEAGLINDQLIAVHMTTLTDEEIEEVANAKASIVHCPESNMKLASGFTPVQKYLDAGINVALGTDGAASNNDLDMLGEMRSAALMAKGLSGDPKALAVNKVLEMATINGAKALHLDDKIGSLEPNKAADMIAIEVSGYLCYPMYHPMSHLVYTAHRMQVDSVWVKGEQLLAKGELVRMNIQKTLAKAHSVVQKIKAQGFCSS